MFAADADTIKVDRTDPSGNAMTILCTVANLPASASGYAVSCLAQTSDGGVYQNTGTATSATWTLIDTASGSLTLPAAATDATTTTTTSLALTQNTVTTGAGLTQSLNGLTTGKGHSITHTTSVISAGGSLLNLSSTGVDTTTTSGALLTMTATLGVAATQVLATFGTTTGIGISEVLAGLTTGTGLNISHTTSVIASGGSMVRITSTGVDTGTTTGTLLDLASTASTASTLIKITSASLTTGKGLVFTLAGLTTGAAIDTTGIAATTQNFNMNSTTGSTAAPQTNAPVGFFKIGIGGTDQWVPYYGAS